MIRDFRFKRIRLSPRPAKDFDRARLRYAMAVNSKPQLVLPDAVNRVRAVMDEVMHTFKNSKDANPCTLLARAFRDLRAAGLLVVERLPPRKCLPHPRNRDGQVLIYGNVNPHLCEIVEVGFHWPITADACAFQIGDAADRAYVENASKEVFIASGGIIPAPSPGEATVAVAVCTHTTAGMRNTVLQAPCDVGKLSEGGRISFAKVEGLAPSSPRR